MFSFVYEAAAVIIGGFVLLRFAGKKVMAEMTTLEMITVLSLGTAIGHALSENQLWKTLVSMVIFVVILRIFQYLTLKFKWIERLMIGWPTLVIKDGKIVEKNLTKLRMTMEQMELRLRRKGISNISDVRTATIEVDGRIGYELVTAAAPLTQAQAEQILAVLKMPAPPSGGSEHKLFEEIRRSGG